MRESSTTRIAFNAYVELGVGRSLEQLHVQLRSDPSAWGFKRAPSLRTLYRWSTELGWQDLIADLEQEARQRNAASLVEALTEMNRRQAEEGVLLQTKAIRRFESIPESQMSANEALRALVEGARLERLARGEVTERASVEKGNDIDLKGFSLAELRAIADLADEIAQGNSPPKPE